MIITNSTLTAAAANSNHYFSSQNTNPSTTSLKEESDTNFTGCKSGSPYYYTLKYNPSGSTGAVNTVNMCIQVVIIPKLTAENAKYYDITVNAKYFLGTQTKTNSLKTYRYGDFKSQ